MKADELAAPSGDTFKFDEIGDTIEGVVTYVGDWQEQDTKFGRITSARIGLDTGNGEIAYIWPRKGSAMAGAIAQALRDANLNELIQGQTLKLRFDSTKDTGKGNPMKVFKARITAANPRATEDPF